MQAIHFWVVQFMLQNLTKSNQFLTIYCTFYAPLTVSLKNFRERNIYVLYMVSARVVGYYCCNLVNVLAHPAHGSCMKYRERLIKLVYRELLVYSHFRFKHILFVLGCNDLTGSCKEVLLECIVLTPQSFEKININMKNYLRTYEVYAHNKNTK